MATSSVQKLCVLAVCVFAVCVHVYSCDHVSSSICRAACGTLLMHQACHVLADLCQPSARLSVVSLADCRQDGVLVSAVLQELPYLLTAAVAGTEFQFFAMERNSLSEPLAIGPRLRLNSPKARALLTIAVINLHRLLRATQALLPGYVLPVDMVQKVTHQEGYTRTL